MALSRCGGVCGRISKLICLLLLRVDNASFSPFVYVLILGQTENETSVKVLCLFACDWSDNQVRLNESDSHQAHLKVSDIDIIVDCTLHSGASVRCSCFK